MNYLAYHPQKVLCFKLLIDIIDFQLMRKLIILITIIIFVLLSTFLSHFIIKIKFINNFKYYLKTHSNHC